MGREYFMELYWRSFFQEVEEDEFGDINYCTMHDIMHDLALQVGGVKCAMLTSHVKDIDRRARHLSFNFSLKSSQQIPISLSQTANSIRTVLLPSQKWEGNVLREGLQICDVIFSNFKFLRALDLHDFGITTLSNSIGKLRHLRYLDLSHTKIKALPNSIMKLQNLQTLKLSWLRDFKELPRDTKKLINLRHLEFRGLRDLNHMPSGLRQLTNLQTLSYFVLSKGTKLRHGCGDHVAELKELMPLNSLRNLCILNLRHAITDGTAGNLKDKQYLQSLTLSWFSSDARKDLETAMESTSSDAYGMTLESFQPLPNLKSLSLEGYGDDSFSPSNAASLMPSLETLHLLDLSNLKGWWRDTVLRLRNIEDDLHYLPNWFKSLTSLRSLIFDGCSKLKHLSPIIQHLISLRDLYIAGCNELDMSNAEVISWKACKSLVSLSFNDLPRLETPPEGLQYFTTLRDLGFLECKNLKAIPEWFSNFTSLTEFRLYVCPNLTSLPEGICSITSLQKLRISGCPILLQRCEREKGEDWPKIAHIPHLYLEPLDNSESSSVSGSSKWKISENFRVPQLCNK
ncbi:putative disease resistance protein RGA1 [Ziziphus jujuba]|uniref:Disease resistance protein RGA1 n=1 Tax=Ziziphus jujuba TaxID=326968 RepID=A0ABM3ZTR9_ZIZJJ|nr:putative disease resistance protein RGA1 [Ziziphus jujuba]